MTATTDTAEHPEIEEIAELAEGLLSAARTTALRTHLTGCADCTEMFVSLEEIRGLLGGFPAAEPLPTAVAHRIDVALAAEHAARLGTPETALTQEEEGEGVRGGDRAAADASTVTAGEDVSRETQRTDGSRQTVAAGASAEAMSADVSRETSPRGSSTRPAHHPGGTSSPGRPGPGRPAPKRYGHRRRRHLVLGGAAAVAALGLGSLLFTAVEGDKGTPSAAPSTGAPAFSGRPLRAQVADLLSQSTTGAAPPSGAASPEMSTKSSPGNAPGDETSGNSALRAGAPEVPRCVSLGIGRAASALAVEQGTYHGTRAYLVVLPHASDTSRVAAYVVEAACVQRRSAVPGKVLLITSYPRP